MIPGTIPAEFEFCSKFRQNEGINLAGPSAKFDSSGILGIAWIPPDSGRNQWRTVKTSDFVLEYAGATAWGVGQISDPVVTRIYQVSKVMNGLGQQNMANTTWHDKK